MNQWKSLGAAEEQSERQFATQSPHCLIEVHGLKKKCLLMCTRQLNLLSEYWWDFSLLELSLTAEVSKKNVLKGLISFVRLMNGFWKSFTFNNGFTPSIDKGRNSSECSLGALLFFCHFFFILQQTLLVQASVFLFSATELGQKNLKRTISY